MRVPLLAAFDKVEHCFDIVAVFGNNVSSVERMVLRHTTLIGRQRSRDHAH